MDAPQVSVIVPVKDRRERMLRCLESLLALEHPSFEVLVLDNGSVDGTAEACRERAATAAIPVRVEGVPGTLGAVRNAGVRLARGEYLAFTDSDCEPDPGWLRWATAALDRDPQLGVVCGRTLPEEREAPTRWPHTIRVERMSWRFETCNAVYRAAALRASKGFFEEVGDGYEDTAAGFAVVEDGWRATYEPRALVRHDLLPGGIGFWIRRERRQQNLAAALGRHPYIRDRLLFGRVFFDVRHALFLLAATGVLAGRWWRWLALPYLAMNLRLFKSPRIAAEATVFDAVFTLWIVRGAIRHRRLVL